MTKKIWFDMDGTIANLYSVEGWLDYLLAEDATPYKAAAVMHNMALLARLLHKVQRNGYTIGIISWTSKSGSDSYNTEVAEVKRDWLAKHLPSVEWDEIKIVPYGTDKLVATGGGILFDDEAGNRENWGKGAYTPDRITEILKALARA